MKIKIGGIEKCFKKSLCGEPEDVGAKLALTTSGKTKMLRKDVTPIGTMGDLEKCATNPQSGKIGTLVVENGMGNVVRRIDATREGIKIDAADGSTPIVLPRNTPVYYEPWFMERGSLIFKNPPGNQYPEGVLLKLATENDPTFREE